MNRGACDFLDDYLAGDLPEQSVVVFESHLPECAQCGQAASFRELLAERLKAAVAAETPPPRLFAEIRSRQIAGRRRGWVAIAAVAASIVGIVWVLNPPPRPGELPIANAPTPAEPAAVQVTFPRDDVLIVPVADGDPGITVMWVYPVVRNPDGDRTESNASIERNVP